MRRLLLISHRSPQLAGGSSARWRSLVRRLPDLGWEVDVISAPQRESAVELPAQASSAASRRAAVTGRIGRIVDPAFAAAGLRPEAVPLATSWLLRGSAEGRRAIARRPYDAIVATGPPMVGPMVARMIARRDGPPVVMEFRDVWAGNPAWDRGGPLLPRAEGWVIAPAARIVVMTPEARQDVAARHPSAAARIVAIPNGFEPELLSRRRPPRRTSGGPITVLHSGTIYPDRPLAPIVRAMERDGRFRLKLHGFVHPDVWATIADSPVVKVLPSGDWNDAIARMLDADACLVTQAEGAGDATAVASKVYEYLALGRPVLCVSDGGATEGVLRRLGVGDLCARLDDPHSIGKALGRLASTPTAQLDAEALAPYSRARIAEQTAALLEEVCEDVRDPR